MGQIVNALIFRSKNFPYYNNIWNNYRYIYKNINYFLNLKRFIKFKKQLNILYINNNYSYTNYCIYNIILFSKLNYINNKYYIQLYFLNFLKKNYTKHIKIGFNFVCLKYPLLSTNFILKYLTNKILFTKISLRKIIPQLILLINNIHKIKGFKCIISGRINGAQMAKLETFKFNESSLQNKNLYIKYNCISIPTKYGLLGVKIWLFLN
uniref:Ribosomal protein S3 n=1 Tax=Cyclospora cayetanensis TaxID=88456 RepID=A0A0K0NU20_9EIME|nr:ribosomal protein S3 [Cyclospora cayetanensis]AKO71981.1 ribosomal protein S3 [Cyclospora cayetanensis]ANJ44332.1 ribosomal protein S3 [Cyclospora cayetanensis]ANN13266.1 ribosomal protein S3 [Cyclospora cayetanensis]ANN13295.1 ribosomal protein S3 [Cyclospora cayetanensis]ANN13324.1 ribosomal protein S3 [Cyclospora cayetanensis]